MDDYVSRRLEAPATLAAITRHILSGIVNKVGDRPEEFNHAYPHRPEAFRAEILEAGLKVEKLIAVESFGWLLPDFEQVWQQDERRKVLLDVLREVEEDTSIMGASAHLLGVARKLPPHQDAAPSCGRRRFAPPA